MVPFDFHPRTRVDLRPGIRRARGPDRARPRHSGARWSSPIPVSVTAGHTAALLDALTADRHRTVSLRRLRRQPRQRDGGGRRRVRRPLAVDSVIGLGGGSSLDCAKGINFVLRNGGTIADYRGYGKAATPLLPMIGIPTTAGTGSEAQSYAVIADAATHMKMACGDPSAAVARRDPRSGPDAHGAAARHRDGRLRRHRARGRSQRSRRRRTPLSDTFSQQAWRLLSDAFERVLLHPADAEARSAMHARRAFRRDGDRTVDARRRPRLRQSAHRALQHPARSGAGDPAAARRPLERRLGHSDRYAALLGAPRRRVRDEDPAETLARRLEDFAVTGHLAITLSDAGVDAAAIPELAAAAAQQWTGTFNPRPFDAGGAEKSTAPPSSHVAAVRRAKCVRCDVRRAVLRATCDVRCDVRRAVLRATCCAASTLCGYLLAVIAHEVQRLRAGVLREAHRPLESLLIDEVAG